MARVQPIEHDELDEDGDPVIEYITSEEAAAELDARARALLGISGEEFIQQWESGALGDWDSSIVALSFMIPLTGHVPLRPPGWELTDLGSQEDEDGAGLPPVVELTLEEGIALLDRQARTYLGMSGDEFIRRWEAGEIDDPDRSDVLRVASLIGFAR